MFPRWRDLQEGARLIPRRYRSPDSLAGSKGFKITVDYILKEFKRLEKEGKLVRKGMALQSWQQGSRMTLFK
ncbi:MAG: hypothetical protein ACFFD4_02270 [Candidatus Odinarchaeota archaeon]